MYLWYCRSQHIRDNYNICLPLGRARRKISIWITEWIQYSTPTNNIINYQINNTITTQI